MKLLLETHLLLWAAGEPKKLSPKARTLILDTQNELMFSAPSVWEVAIKRTLGRAHFQVDSRLFRRGLIDNGYVELPVLSAHAVAVEALPPIHKDPIDRLLIAQMLIEGIALMTTDAMIAQYGGSVRLV